MNLPGPTQKQAKVIWFAVTALAVALTLGLIGMVFWGLGYVVRVLSPVLWPIAVAGVIAYILDPVVDWLVSKRIPRLRAILLVFTVAAVVVLGVLGSVVPRAVVEARDLAGRIPTYVENAQHRLAAWINNPSTSVSLRRLLPESLQQRLGVPPARTNAPATNAPAEPAPSAEIADRTPSAPGTTNLQSALPPSTPASPWWVKALDPRTLKTAGGWLAAILPEVGRWLVGQVGKVASWFGVLAGLALIPIYTFYFLLEKAGIERQWTDYLPVKNSAFKDELVWLLKNINDSLIVFFRGQVLVAICDGIMYGVGFLVIGLPYALLIGLIATVLTIIPFLGAIVTCATALGIALLQFGGWKQPLLVLCVFAVVQTIEGWIVQPKIIGDRVGLHPVTIIIALMIGTNLLGGILGGILAIPLTAALRALLARYVWKGRGAHATKAQAEPAA